MNRPLHALVIEDESDVLDLLLGHLDRLGCRVSGALTGTQGMALARAEPPDVVVVDVMLPDIDGREVVRLLRQDERTAHCPIVLCSVLDPGDLQDVCADAMLPKPFTRADVGRLVRQLTEAKTGERQP